MSMLSKQVKELRELANSKELEMHEPVTYGFYGKIKSKLFRAADTIEALSAKLQASNDELNRWHTDHINEKIKNPFAYTSTIICHNCDHKDEYIEELEAEVEELKAANMENCGGWIACEDRLPDKDDTVLIDTGIGYFEIATYSGDGKTFYTEECGSSCPVAWQYLPQPYRP